ncbi:MAG: glutamine--tRNA ligase/YqeY domain fusion protein [Myxococcales bacterium]|nr:glutamine--tRNA ligase/YqeY domain fusion protein [Myxococcales bacterium]
MTDTEASARSNFLRAIIDADLAAGRYPHPVTRFPPEPNGFLHIGHVKSICLNFGIARDYPGGVCHLRMDDTNPLVEEELFIENIKSDVRWLGFDWHGKLFHASDYFEFMYDCAEHLVRTGKAYVCSLSVDDIRATRGTLTEPGKPSPDRDRPADESLDLLRRMRAGEFPDGSYTLRAKIDMASPNMLMRDPLLYRIRHAHHPRTGEKWCIYPMYDYAHCLSDSHEGITHSICTLEFENNRELYDWVLANTPVKHVSHQYEFAKLALTYTMLSKRRLRLLVEEGHVAGWDDPRMPTIAGMRRRGIPPAALRALADAVGVTKNNTVIDITRLDHHIRDVLNTEAPRVMAVLDPLEVVVTTWPEGETDALDASYWPHDVPKEGSRKVPFGRTLYIERSDFEEEPPPGFYRLAPGREVRLRYGYLIRCDEVVRDESGRVVQLRCSHDPASRGGRAPDGRKVRGTIHWVAADGALDCEVRLYDRLFAAEFPGSDRDWLEDLNPDSLRTLTGCKIEPSVAGDPVETRYQFERQGYFWRDPVDGAGDRLVFDRIIDLRDSWAKAQAEADEAPAAVEAPASEPARKVDTRPQKRTAAQIRAAARAADPTLAEREARYRDALGLAADDADLLTGDRGLSDLFEAAIARYDAAASVAKWMVNVLVGELGDRAAADLPLDGGELGALARLVDDGTVSATAGKEVLAELMDQGGAAEAIVEARGLRRLDDAAALARIVDAVIAAHPEQAAQYREGKTSLAGFFIGKAMQQSGGRADPRAVRTLVTSKLDG